MLGILMEKFIQRLSILFLILFSIQVNAEEIPTGKLPDTVKPTHYWLDLNIVPQTENYSGTVKIDVTISKPTNKIWMHGQGLMISDAYIQVSNGNNIDAVYTEVNRDGVVKLEIEQLIEGKATIFISFSSKFNQSLEGLYQVKRDGKSYIYTQFQALRARKAFPSFDEPRFKTPFDISVIVSGDNVAISNAPEIKSTPLSDSQRRIVFQTTKPIPTYLLALAVGEFDIVEWQDIQPNDIRSEPIPLRGIAAKGKGEKLHYALKNTEELLAILEEYFLIPYPYAKLDLISVEDFNPSGMENVGAIFYRQDRILFDKNPSIHQLRDFAYLHAHELAHTWFGNLVTPAWWDDLWLNEAFATWMSSKVVNTWQPESYDERAPIRGANWAMWSDRLISARQVRQPINSNDDVVNAFDSITYSKGSSILAMIERFIGKDVFRNGVRKFILANEHDSATARDFFKAMSESTDNDDLINVFNSFIKQPGTPMVSLDWSCDDQGNTKINFSQSRNLPLGSKGDAKKSWMLPVCLIYGFEDQRVENCLLLKEPASSVSLDTENCPQWVFPNGGGSAYMNFSLSSTGWDNLIRNMKYLEAGELLSLVKSAEAAYEAGLIDTQRLLQISKIAAKSDHWDVVKAPMQPLRNLKNYVLTLDQRSQILKVLQEIYLPALNRFQINEETLSKNAGSSDLALLRSDIIWFMAFDAEYPELRKLLTKLAQSYLGYGEIQKANPSVLHPDLVRVALIVAGQELKLPFIDFLINLLYSTDDAALQRHVIYALGFQTNETLVKRVQKAILAPETRRSDASQLLRRQAQRVDNREYVFSWIVKHYDQLLEKIPSSHHAWLVWRASNFCSEDDRNRVQEFFGERSKEHRGGSKAIVNVLEAIEICAAIHEVQFANASETVNSY